MSSKKKNLLSLLTIIVTTVSAVCYMFYIYGDHGTRRAIEGLPEPVQTEATGDVSKSVDGYDVLITFKYSYKVDALVVHTERYNGSKVNDKLSPVDLGLAWGGVAANNTKIDFHWSQSGRWIYWEVDRSGEIAHLGGVDGVSRQCSNNHIIPATSDVKDKVKKIREGDRVMLEGYLVDVYGEKPDGSWFEWNTSTSRDDTGNGACEVFYVTDVQITK